jgi:hypothetical protein
MGIANIHFRAPIFHEQKCAEHLEEGLCALSAICLIGNLIMRYSFSFETGVNTLTGSYMVKSYVKQRNQASWLIPLVFKTQKGHHDLFRSETCTWQ